MIRRPLYALALAAAGCATAIPPGAGEVSRAARDRWASEAFAARVDGVMRACRVADARPDDPRAQRKAADLAYDLLYLGRGKLAPDPIMQAAAPTLARLDGGCETRLDSARVYEAAAQPERAAERYVQSAHECRQVGAGLEAARLLHDLHRCDEAVALIAALWPASHPDQHVALMDAVSSCSDAVSLRENLSFVPPSVLDDYFGLLEQRRREEEQREVEAAQAAAAAQAQAQADEARGRCEDLCARSVGQCESACGGRAECSSRCQSRGSACRAGCQ